MNASFAVNTKFLLMTLTECIILNAVSIHNENVFYTSNQIKL